MAPRVGEALREARTQRGIALNDVERVTKIRVNVLRAMEEERWDELPDRVSAREALAAYARYLGLDEQALVEEHESSRERPGHPRPVPAGVVRPAGLSRDRPLNPLVLIAAGAVTVVLLGLVLVAALGSDDGGNHAATEPAAAEKPRGGGTSTSATTRSTTVASSEVTVQLSATADVWVCLVDASGSQPVNGETLTAGAARGPFTSRRFEMTFGNGSIELTVNGDPVTVPPLAEPLGFRVTPEGAKRLAPGSRPSCS